MIDFNKLRQYQEECNNSISSMCIMYNLDFNECKNICRELSCQTQYKYSEAIDIVGECLFKGKIHQDIIRIYNLKM